MNTMVIHVQMFQITDFWNAMPCDDLLPPTAEYTSNTSTEKGCNDVQKGRTGR
jgi:hypothetical protein